LYYFHKKLKLKKKKKNIFSGFFWVGFFRWIFWVGFLLPTLPDPGLEADPRHIAQPAQLSAQRHQLAARRRWLLLVGQAQQLVKQSEHTCATESEIKV
jgi:hypothetical protein